MSVEPTHSTQPRVILIVIPWELRERPCPDRAVVQSNRSPKLAATCPNASVSKPSNVFLRRGTDRQLQEATPITPERFVNSSVEIAI